ncbi:MAG: hypothetical protein NTX88_02130 [Candidatus Atribacteria bacterium]|nr:hypothetical protein [Candidatus Atribacteria bacterium]
METRPILKDEKSMGFPCELCYETNGFADIWDNEYLDVFPQDDEVTDFTFKERIM